MVKPSRKLKKIFLIAGITGAVYAGFQYLLPLVIPFLIAYMIALGLKPSAHWLRQKLSLTFRGRTYRPPVGAVGGGEMAILAAFFGWLACRGLCRLGREAALLSERLPRWIRILDAWLTGKCRSAELFFGLRRDVLVDLARDMVEQLSRDVRAEAMPFVVENSAAVLERAAGILVMCAFGFLAVILSLEEMEDLRRRRDSSMFRREYALIGNRLAMAGRAYLKTQGITMALTMAVSTAGLWVLGSPYPIILGMVIGLLDALPVLGTGTVFVPWALVLAAGGEWGRAAGFLALYLACYFLREFMEARIMGNEIGLTPLESLAAIYVGWRLFGLTGFILGPVGLILIEDLVEAAEKSQLFSGGECE